MRRSRENCARVKAGSIGKKSRRPKTTLEDGNTFAVNRDQFSVQSRFVMQTLSNKSILVNTVTFLDLKRGAFTETCVALWRGTQSLCMVSWRMARQFWLD